MLKIYEESLFQDKRIRELFPSSERPFNKEKKRKYENHLKKLGKIAYDELFLSCNTNKDFSKIYRINKCGYKKKSSTTITLCKNHYVLMIPKTFKLVHFVFKNRAEINEYKTINVKYLNQKVSINIYEDTFFYYIETFLRLPNYSKNVKYWFKKQFDDYILKLLREGKLIKKAYSDKIMQNIEKIVKNRGYRHYFLKGYYSVFALLNKSERDKHFFGISRLRFKKTGICFFHNVRLMVNGKMVILTRDINRMLGNGFNDIGELFESFLDIGLTAIGIDITATTSLKLVSFEVARELSQFDKTEHRDIPVSKYGKDTKRDLGYIEFENFYDHIDYSSIDDYGNPIPEYEIKGINRKDKTIPEVMRELGILFPFEKKEQKEPIIEVDIGIIEIIPFDITASKPEITRFRNAIATFGKDIYEIKDLYGFRYRTKCVIYNES